MSQERRFTVIENKELIEKDKKKENANSYHSNPMTWQKDYIREKFAKFVNQEGGHKFSVEDLLRC